MTHRSMHHKLPRAITFDPIVGFSRFIPFQKQEVKIFPGVSGSTLFLAFQGRRLKMHVEAINSPRHPINQEDHIFSEVCPLPNFSTRFSLPNTKNTQDTHQSFLILLSSPKTQGIVLIPNLPFLGSTLWFWGLGVWIWLF